jgi:hypothetical protein
MVKLTFNESTYQFVVNRISEETYFNGDTIVTENGVMVVNGLNSIPFECFYEKGSSRAFYQLLSNDGEFDTISGEKGFPMDVVFQIISLYNFEISK